MALSSLFFESFLFWIVVGTCLFIVGYAFSQGLGQRKYAFAGLALGLAFVGIGAFLVFAVKTDPKSIRKTIFAVEKAVENNDSDELEKYIAKDAVFVRRAATNNLTNVHIEKAKISNLKIDEINLSTSPPKAFVSLRGMAQGKDAYGYPFVVLVQFNVVELRKEQDGVWRLTDHIEIDSNSL